MNMRKHIRYLSLLLLTVSVIFVLHINIGVIDQTSFLNSPEPLIELDLGTKSRYPITTLSNNLLQPENKTVPNLAVTYLTVVTSTSSNKPRIIQDYNGITHIWNSSVIEYERKQSVPWRKIPECKEFRTYFAKEHTFPRCYLASFPGSGNTWARYLIEGSTSIFSASDSTDGLLFAHGYYGENEPLALGTTVVQKTHSHSQTVMKSSNGRAILLIRNPYRAIMAYHNYLYSSHKMYAPISSFRSKNWEAFVDIEARKWFETFNSWVKFSSTILVVHYEDLMDNPIRQLKRIHKYLKLPMLKERLNCIKKSKSGRFKRKVQYLPTNLEIFLESKRQKLDKAINYLDYMLRKYNHPPPPLKFYEFYNGTSYTKFKFTDCLKNETIIECDNRIDEINIGQWDFFNYVQKTVQNGESVTNEKTANSSFQESEKSDIISIVTALVYKNLAFLRKDPIEEMLETVHNSSLSIDNIETSS